MILDVIQHSARYAGLHEGFAEALAYLSGTDWGSAPPDLTVSLGGGVKLTRAAGAGRGRSAARLEAHRQFIDIQYVLGGVDLMGWRALSDCRRVAVPYDPAQDLVFFAERPRAWLPVPAGCLVIFFPEDTHAPLAGAGAVDKVVVKVPRVPGGAP